MVDRVVYEDAGHDLGDKICVPLAAGLFSRFDMIIWCEDAEYDCADLTDDYIATSLRFVRFSD